MAFRDVHINCDVSNLDVDILANHNLDVDKRTLFVQF
jgi:hypothetical protein